DSSREDAMATPSKPPRTDPPPSTDWLNLSQVVPPAPKSDGDTSLPPLTGLPTLKRPGPVTPMPAAQPRETPAPVWTEASVYVPPPPLPSASKPDPVPAVASGRT